MKFVRRLIRKFNQRRRLNRLGWASFGQILCGNSRSDFYVKRSNWIYNLLNYGISFKGTI